MSQKLLTLRQAAKKIYEENSKRISDCYELEGLKKISVIFVPADAPFYVKEIAAQIRQFVKQKYENRETEIVLTTALFKSPSYTEDYLNMVYKNISDNLEARHAAASCSDKIEALLLCTPQVAAEMLRFRGKAIETYGEKNIPSLFLDVQSYRLNNENPVDEIAYRAGVAPAVLKAYAPYVRKIYRRSEYLITYASGFESWQDLIYAWHENRRLYKQKPKIVYIDDIRPWTSSEYSARIFHKFCKLLRRLGGKDAFLLNIPSTIPQLVLDTIREKTAIIFIPQLKTYYCKHFYGKGCSANQITFEIYEKLFDEYWENSGPIARQFFCQELKEFTQSWSNEVYQQRGYGFCQLFQSRIFKNWNLKFYWWNHKIRLGNICRQIYLSEYCIIRDKYRD